MVGGRCRWSQLLEHGNFAINGLGMFQDQSICLVGIEFEPVGLAVLVLAWSYCSHSLSMSCIRDHKAILFGSKKVELQRVPDAAWPVDGGDVGHGGV